MTDEVDLEEVDTELLRAFVEKRKQLCLMVRDMIEAKFGDAGSLSVEWSSDSWIVFWSPDDFEPLRSRSVSGSSVAATVRALEAAIGGDQA